MQTPITIFVNVDVAQTFTDHKRTLVRRVSIGLAAFSDLAGTPPKLVNSESVSSALAQLREHGIHIAHDDFGKGQTQRLRELDCDMLKVTSRLNQWPPRDPGLLSRWSATWVETSA